MSEQVDRKQIIKAIWDSNGKITLAARRLGCARLTIYRAAEKWASVQNAIDESRGHFDEELLDIAEAKLRSDALEGKPWAIRYVLDKKGKDRGYSERFEHTGKDGGPVTLRILRDSISEPDIDGDE